jgi:predicted HD superfamily hydrolase involved in NAD metabolism
MDYTVDLKKILSEKQFAFLQSITASARAVMSPELYNHSVGTFNSCFKMADRFLLNRAKNGFEKFNSSGDPKDFLSVSGFEHCVGAGTGGGLKDCTSIGAAGRNYYKKTIPELCFDLAAAAILHDYGKTFSIEELKDIAAKQKLRISDFELNCEPILHSFMAPFLIKRDFKIKERDVLNSAGMHTTGSLKMSTTDKILYIADKIEETRDYEGVEKLRHLSLEDINLCLLEVYKSNIIYVIKGNNVLHPDTAKIWNYIRGGLRHAT